MAKVSHTSPQKTRTNKSRKSVLKTYNLVKQNDKTKQTIRRTTANKIKFS
jgi:hypothetical protein